MSRKQNGMLNFSRLYNLSHSKNISVAKVFIEVWRALTFRRSLCGELAELWGWLKYLCAQGTLKEVDDRCFLTLTKCGVFTIRSL